ncbi:MAG: hypothetical protein QM490_05465 [Candidatus Gracilibacteria bacterium]
MKKILISFLLYLIIFLLGCSTNETIVINQEESSSKVSSFEIIEIMSEKCVEDSECKTPFSYLLLSHCPYKSKCIENKCTVICPKPFVGKKIEQ